MSQILDSIAKEIGDTIAGNMDTIISKHLVGEVSHYLIVSRYLRYINYDEKVEVTKPVLREIRQRVEKFYPSVIVDTIVVDNTNETTNPLMKVTLIVKTDKK